MALDPKTIYQHHSDKYHELVLAEDREKNLLPAIEAIRPVADTKILEVGAGTGRITRQLVERGAYVDAFDSEEAMLETARDYLAPLERGRYRFRQADARQLPVDDEWADLAIAGWVFGHFRYWMPENWRQEVGQAMAEMNRALRPGGVGIIIETLGTGAREPSPPPGLAEYYDWLVLEKGCTAETIRTDYQFCDVETAAETLGFFFGPELAGRIRAENSATVCEVTGLWWWQKP